VGLPNDDQLEFVLKQLERLEDAEDERRKTADAKLTTTISIMPVVVALATSSAFPIIQNTNALRGWRYTVIPLYGVAILCFLAGVAWALRAIWPTRAKYSQPQIGSISKYRKPGTRHRDLLEELIVARRDSLRINQDVNARKLGEYMDSVVWSFCGLIAVVAAVIALLVGIVVGEIRPVDNGVSTSVNHPSDRSAHVRPVPRNSAAKPATAAPKYQHHRP
jgi:hypothetical protein